MKGQIHLFCAEWPELFSGETRSSICGRAIQQATPVFMWDDTVAGCPLHLDSMKVCRYCVIALAEKRGLDPEQSKISYVYGILPGEEARALQQRLEMQIA